MYDMVCTRLDISQAVSIVGLYMKCLDKIHWEAITWILRYLMGIADVGIVYQWDRNGSETIGYVDSNHAGYLDDRQT